MQSFFTDMSGIYGKNWIKMNVSFNEIHKALM